MCTHTERNMHSKLLKRGGAKLHFSKVQDKKD